MLQSWNEDIKIPGPGGWIGFYAGEKAIMTPFGTAGAVLLVLRVSDQHDLRDFRASDCRSALRMEVVSCVEGGPPGFAPAAA